MEQEQSSKPRLWTKDFILTSLSNLFLFFSFHMLTPTLPVYVVKMNGNEFEAGMVVGIFTVTALLIRPFAGRALDTMGRSKILLAGLLIFGLSVISYQWMVAVNLILLIRAVQGIGWGMTTTSYGTMVSDLIAPERRAEGMGYYGISINIAMACAPFTGIWMMNRYGFTTLFLSAALPVAFSLILRSFIFFPPLAPRPEAKNNALIEKNALFPSFLVMLMTLAHGGILSSLTLFGQEVGIANVGWFFLANAVVIMLTRPVAGKIFDQKGHVYVLFPGGVSIALGLLLLSYSTNILTLTVAAVFYGLGFGSILPSLQAWSINCAAPERRGVANGTFFAAFDLGIGVGAMMIGIIAKWFHYAETYRISILFIVVYSLVYGTYLIRGRNQSNVPQ